MPTTSGMEFLVHQTPLSLETWLELLEARRKLLKPEFSRFTLPPLGKLECLRADTHQHALGDNGPAVESPDGLTLKDQGIFRVQPYEAIERFPNSGYRPGLGGCPVPDGIKRIWGILRSGDWALVTVHYYGEPGYKDYGYECAIRVIIAKVNLATMLTETKEKPQVIWQALGDLVCQWAETRQRLYEHALELAQIVKAEEAALYLIPAGD